MPSPLLLRNFEPGATYHLRHESNPTETLFRDIADYKNFLLTLSYYLRFPGGTPLSWVPRMNPRTLAERQGTAKHHGALPCTLHAFLLLPTHLHLVLTEHIGGNKPGISELMRRVSVGYAMTYRQRYKRQGTIYKGKYKMIKVENSQASSLVAYLHAHPAANSTYLRDPLHSSLSDYDSAPRPWIAPFSISYPLPSLSPRLTLE